MTKLKSLKSFKYSSIFTDMFYRRTDVFTYSIKERRLELCSSS